MLDPESVLLTVVAYDDDGRPVGHACLRRLDGPVAGDLEIKRMFVEPGGRGSGVADALLAAIEPRARDEGVPRVVIHTGDRQIAALRFYERHGYTPDRRLSSLRGGYVLTVLREGPLSPHRM